MILCIEGFSLGLGVTEMKSPSPHLLVCLARLSIEAFILRGEVISPPEPLPPEMQRRAGVFVSLKRFGQLRGCVGTFLPTRDNLAEEVIYNAISAATQDPRFPPLQPSELADLQITVDVLSQPERVEDPSSLNPKKYGLIVKAGPKAGLLLPDIPGVDTVEDQIRICRLKAGIGPEEPVELLRFEVERYR